MNYTLLNNDSNIPLLERLLAARGVADLPEDFCNPSFSRYRQSPALLSDIEKATERLLQAIKSKEKIMVFGDYDVDGVSASYIIYTFFKRYLHYTDISIRLPHRLDDGYGIKTYHLDEIKEKHVSLVITVDNGITAIQEAEHAKKIGLDLIITDHHRQLDHIPEALAVVNPNLSPDMQFKEICGATVAFKVIRALTEKLIADRAQKDEIFHYFLPIVTIATIADCMPLVDENRLLVKYGLQLINNATGQNRQEAGAPSYYNSARKTSHTKISNTQSKQEYSMNTDNITISGNGTIPQNRQIPESLQNFISYLNIKGPLDARHVGFLIAPRLNAGGRVMTPYDSLFTLLHTGEKQLKYLENLDKLNDQRKKMQDSISTYAEEKYSEQLTDPNIPLIMIGSADFHEGVIGIVAGKLAEKYNKPTIVYSENHETGLAVASLRSPDYASIIDLLYNTSDFLERYGGHKQAGGLTIKLEKIPAFYEAATNYSIQQRQTANKQKSYQVDTILHPHEYTTESLEIANSLAPFGEGNQEPIFLLENILLTKVEKVGKSGNGHLKIHGKYGDSGNTQISCLFWGAGNESELLHPEETISIIGELKKDDYRGGVYIKGISRKLISSL